jgi:hypothetical protein
MGVTRNTVYSGAHNTWMILVGLRGQDERRTTTALSPVFYTPAVATPDSISSQNPGPSVSIRKVFL